MYIFLQRDVQSRSPQPGDTTCSYYHTQSQATHPDVSLWLSDTTPPLAQYHLFFTNTFTFSHPPNFVLLCLNIYFSLPSYVLTSQKSAKWTSRSEPDFSINVMVLYTVQRHFLQDRQEQTLQAAILTVSSLNCLKGGGRFGNPKACPLGTFESNYKMAASEGEDWISTIL